MSEPVIRMRGITKAFPGVIALKKVDFDLKPGEIHALIGKNGAGKSTLISILSGVYGIDEGEILFQGATIDSHHIQDLPVATVYQESTLFSNMTVADNIFCGDEPTSMLSVVNDKEKLRATEDLLDIFQMNLSPATPMVQLSPAEQKVIEILRAIRKNCKILILDEPTATLTRRETEKLFGLLKRLKQTNVGIIYISHRLEEIFQIADRVTVIRDGELQGCVEIGDTSLDRLITMMVGRQTDLLKIVKKQTVAENRKDEPVLAGKSLTHHFGKFRDASFRLYQNEILGVVGLVGAGKTELARALFGLEKIDEGTVLLEGKPVHITSPKQAVDAGIVYVTESRKVDGLFLDMSLKANICATRLDEISGFLGTVSAKKMTTLCESAVEKFDIATTGLDQTANTLSGGNQQKVLLGIWLQLKPKVLIVDEPTVGIDVSTKADVYALLRSIADQGTAVMLISSEIKEVMNNADRIISMYNGRLTGSFIPADTKESEILEHISASVMEVS
jgi:ribose transport system ATP-binding protein